MFRNQQPQQNQPYIGKSGNWWTVAVFGWLSFATGGQPLFLILFIVFLFKLVFDISVHRKWQNIPTQRGPLEQRREQQMRKYDQIPQSNGRPTPQTSAKANPYKESGMKKYKVFDLQDAIEDFEKGLSISPNDLALHFNIACAFSLTENKAKAYHHLSKSVALGLKDIDKIMLHDDLAYVRIQPEFESFRKSGFLTNPYVLPQNPAPEVQQKPAEVAEEPSVDSSLLTHLSKLAEMRQKGIISDEEFVLERKKILRQ
jgi:tetratricopeptide (TPR) repeat protein